jgi:lysophospholipase L1-like esterase
MRSTSFALPGETTASLYNTITSVNLAAIKTIFIMVGTNDIARNVSANHSYMNIISIIRYLEDFKLDVYFISVINASIWKRSNSRIDEFNIEVINITNEYNLNFLSVDKYFIENGNIDNKYFVDGLHLSETGNNKFCSVIKRVINNLK